MTTKLAALLALLVAAVACPIAETDFTPFGKRCSSSTCGPRYQCDVNAGVCVPIASEGEGEGAAGEGEGAHPGEGEGVAGEGEGGAGEGEGTSSEGEGTSSEGEGEGAATGTCFDNACECAPDEVCTFGTCGPHLPVCLQDSDCGRTATCNPAAPSFFGCDGSTNLCVGRSPNVVVTAHWLGPAELMTHVIKKDALGEYCVDTHILDSQAQVAPLASICDADPQLDCDYDCGTSVDGYIHWGSGDDAIPANLEVDQGAENFEDVIAAYGAGEGDYLVAIYFFNDDNGVQENATVDLDITDGAGTDELNVSKPIANLYTWREVAHFHIDASGTITCASTDLSASSSCPP